MRHKTEREHSEAGTAVVCSYREEVYRKGKFRCTNRSNGYNDRNSCSKFSRSRRDDTDSGYFDHGR